MLFHCLSLQCRTEHGLKTLCCDGAINCLWMSERPQFHGQFRKAIFFMDWLRRVRTWWNHSLIDLFATFLSMLATRHTIGHLHYFVCILSIICRPSVTGRYNHYGSPKVESRIRSFAIHLAPTWTNTYNNPRMANHEPWRPNNLITSTGEFTDGFFSSTWSS